MLNENESVNASAEAIIELTHDLNNSIKEINNLSNDLGLLLKRLGVTLQDQGYVTIQGYISRTQKRVDEVIPHLKTVMKGLLEYAKLINKSRSIIGSAGESLPTSLTQKATYERTKGLRTNGQTWKPNEDGTMTFNSPVETGLTLDANQGKVNGFSGTCGLVSCANLIKLSGKAMTEEQMVKFASDNNFCDQCGATPYKNRRDILLSFGIKNELQDATVDNIAKAVSEGRGVIASVHADKLWQDPDAKGGHAITITSLKKDNSGNVLGFFVCDSGTGGDDSSKFYSTDQIKNSLTDRQLNVTMIIR